ncbi:MAG: hypothetical protein KDB71_05825 [Mycobacterium sp.]|nr:hypothetical protein [Mycobacterium sp.]
MSAIEISRRLEEWGAAAGYSLTPGGTSDDGRAIFWSRSGELRYFVGMGEDDWFVITGSDWLGPEHLESAAPAWQTIEKYLYGDFADSIRFLRRLPPVHLPATKDELAPGYALSTEHFDGRDRGALLASDGSVVAVSRGDEISATMWLVFPALLLNSSIDDITAASTSAAGSPLYNRQRTGGR